MLDLRWFTHRFTYLLATAVTVAALGCQNDATAPDPAPASPVPDFAVASNSWITRHDMPIERYAFATATVTNAAGQSILYAIGGRNATGGSLSRVQAYNVATDSWTYKAPLPVQLFDMNGAGVINGKIYVSGGLSGYQRWQWGLYMYNPATNTWTRKHDMPFTSSGGVTGVINNRLYVLTNCSPEGCYFSDDLPVFLRYNPVTDAWTTLPAPSSAHYNGMAGVIGGKFYVTGGGTVDSRHLDVYDPATNTWTTKAPIPRIRFNAAGVALGGKLYLIGGKQVSADGSTYTATRNNSVYDPGTNSWTFKAPLPSAKADLEGSRVELNGKPRIEVVGGPRPGTNLQYIP